MTVVLDYGDQPIVRKQHDTHGAISLIVSSGLVSAIQTATATFSLWNIDGGAAVLTDEAATISSAAEDSETGTWGCVLSYTLQATDLDNVGTFLFEWEITYADATKQTLPADNSLRLEVIGDFDGS